MDLKKYERDHSKDCPPFKLRADLDKQRRCLKVAGEKGEYPSKEKCFPCWLEFSNRGKK